MNFGYLLVCESLVHVSVDQGERNALLAFLNLLSSVNIKQANAFQDGTAALSDNLFYSADFHFLLNKQSYVS